MISFEVKGDFKNTERFLRKMRSQDYMNVLQGLGRRGVQALAAATPSQSGQTAASWGYSVTISKGSTEIQWTNSHVVAGVPIVILLQYGHGTGTGGYVRGRDFINPAIKPIFDEIAEGVWKAVTTA